MGFSTVMAIVGATIVVAGPRDLPKVARRIGYTFGRSLSFLRSARGAIREASKGMSEPFLSELSGLALVDRSEN